MMAMFSATIRHWFLSSCGDDLRMRLTAEKWLGDQWAHKRAKTIREIESLVEENVNRKWLNSLKKTIYIECKRIGLKFQEVIIEVTNFAHHRARRRQILCAHALSLNLAISLSFGLYVSLFFPCGIKTQHWFLVKQKTYLKIRRDLENKPKSFISFK